MLLLMLGKRVGRNKARLVRNRVHMLAMACHDNVWMRVSMLLLLLLLLHGMEVVLSMIMMMLLLEMRLMGDREGLKTGRNATMNQGTISCC